MRLIHLAGYYGPYRGSFVPMLEAVAAEAAARGWESELVFPEAIRDRAWVPELSEKATVRFMPATKKAVAGLLAESAEPTMLHTHFTAFDVPAVRAAGRDARVFWHLHSRAESGIPVVLRNRVKYAMVGRRVERILCVGEGILASARRRGAPASKLLLLPNAIDAGRFAAAPLEERRAARAALALPADVPVLLHFGWDWVTKGGDLFLALAARLDRPLVALTVGAGDQATARVQLLGLEDVVRVLPPAERVEELYAAADVFVASSPAEGMPYSVAEAVSTGLAVVATDIPGHRGGGPGVWLGATEDELARELEEVLARDEAQVAADAAAARTFAVEHLDLAVWVRRLFELYDEPLSPARGRAA
jgi:glycosyltransferase involved in cell wall biosynthesis